MAEKALIAMSGGVDSSVAAFLMKEAGFECTGCTMKLFDKYNNDEPSGKTCCSLDDVEDARRVASGLGISYYVFDFREGFRENVIDRFIEAYKNGITPNPCIDCNRYMKFDGLYRRAKELGCDYIVTGHYARIEKEGGRYILKKALDPAKDQSYVLYFFTQEQLAHTMFPLGEMNKTETRRIALENGFVNAAKPDSQDICFVPDGDYAGVIKEYTGYVPEEGDFIDLDGKPMGRHKGIIHYTVGQRKGLGVTFGEPKYVCRIDALNNTVTLGNNEDLFEKEVRVKDINWISGETPAQEFRCSAKIRYNQKEQPAAVIPNGDTALIIFDEPQRAITPGQKAVMYIGDTVLGGGTIYR